MREFQEAPLFGQRSGDPRLLEIPCSAITQMQLVNTLCWDKVYADATASS
jgi:hypothetical protein